MKRLKLVIFQRFLDNCNISRPLRDDDSTINLTQGEKFFGIFYDIFRGNSNKNLHFPRINMSIIKLRRKSHNLSQKSLFWTSKGPFAIRSFIASYNVCPVAIPELFAQTQGSDYWQLIHLV